MYYSAKKNTALLLWQEYKRDIPLTRINIKVDNNHVLPHENSVNIK